MINIPNVIHEGPHIFFRNWIYSRRIYVEGSFIKIVHLVEIVEINIENLIFVTS